MATSTESMDELLQCSICLERFTSPKVLPCQHTFCLNCLRGITKGAHTLACPQCRKDHRLPTNGVVDFEDNLTIKTLLGLFVEAAACFDCSRMLSLSKCQHCAQEVCGDCRASHTKLVAEIDFVFRFIKSTTDDECSDDSERNCANNVIWKDLLDRVVTERERVPVMFDHLERKLAKRKDSVLIFLEAMERRSRILVNQDKPRMVQAMTEQLDACQTTSQLKEFKHLLESTEGTLAAVLENGRGSDFEMSYDSEAVVTCFGNVSCGDTTIDVDIDEGRDGRTSHRSTSLLDSNRTSQRSNSSVQAGAENSELSELRRGLDRLTHEQQPAATGEADAKCNLPSNVNYKAKNSTMKIYIDRHPDDGKVLHPRYALYSTRLNSIFCLSGEPSKGQVIVYALDGSGGRTLSPLILAANHIAVSDSGKLIIAESSVITIVDMVASQGVKSKNALVRLELQEGISLASQVCCYLNEFVVLDSQQKCLMIFSEEGEFVREIVVGNIPELGPQKIAIDHEGCIYIHGGSRVVERKDVGEEKGCKHQRKLSSVTVQSVMFISVLTWDGTFSKIVELVCWPRRYDYKFNGETCCGVHTRNKKSVPTDEAIIKENSIRRFCVDSDGFICVTKMNYHVIEVYNQKGQLHCTIGDTNKGVAHGFSDPSGVSLMPGGRLIVCDTGNKRIQIL